MLKRGVYALLILVLETALGTFFATEAVDAGMVSELLAEYARGFIGGTVSAVLILWVLGALREPSVFHYHVDE